MRAAALLVLTSACATATVHRHDLPELEGTIVRSDADGVVLSHERGLLRIPGEQIERIDHPGTGWMIGAAVATVFAGLAAVDLATNGAEARERGAVNVTVGYTLIAAALGYHGVRMRLTSLEAAEGFTSPRDTALPPPR